MEQLLVNISERIEQRRRAEKLVLSCGVRADLVGCDRLVDAVLLHNAGGCRTFRELYSRLSGEHGIKYKSVMREITYAITNAFDLPERLSALVGITIQPADIHSSLVIAYLSKLLSDPDVFTGVTPMLRRSTPDDRKE